MARKKKDNGLKIVVKGSARLMCVNPDGSLAWKTPWCHNMVTNEGFDDYICQGLTSTTDAKHLSFMALGTGTAAIVSDATALVGELQNTAGSHTRIGFTVSVSSSRTLRLYATYVSGSNSHFSAAQTLGCIGLFHTSNSGTMFSALTYATQAISTNQQVNATYQLSFATTT